METLSVRCNHCGAPLPVAGSTRFVTCQFCQSSLEVKRTGSSVFTEEVAKIAENTGKMAESLDVMKLQQEIETLDREHPEEHAAIFNVLGSRAFGAWVALIVVGLVIVLGPLLSSSQKAGPAIGGTLLVIGIVVLGRKAMRFLTDKAAASAYGQRRAELTRKLNELTKG